MYDVFISHSSIDKQAIVLPLVEQLEENGFAVWLDQKEVAYGENIFTRVNDGIQNSFSVLLILTPTFFESFWTPLELGISFSHPISNHIIPLIVNVSRDDIQKKFPWILTIKYIVYDFDNTNKTIAQIIEAITRIKFKSKHELPELIYRDAVRRLHNFDIPASNKVSILVTEYDQIAKINMQAAFYQASQIAKTIVDYLSEKNLANYINCDYNQKIYKLLHQSAGLNNNVYEHLRLLLSTTPENLLTTFTSDVSKKKLVDMSLAHILDWYTTYLSTSISANEECLVIVKPGTLSREDFDDMHEIDTLVLRSDLIASANIAFAWYEYNAYSHIAIRSQATRKVVGYITLFPITEDLFQQIKKGDFKDNDLSTANIRRYDMPDFYILYIACVAIHPKYHNTKAFSFLYRAAIQMLLDLAVEREVYITEIITEASTLQGEKLCKIVGLQKTLETNIDTSLYQGTLLPPSLRLKSLAGSKLINFYQEKYKEFKLLF